MIEIEDISLDLGSFSIDSLSLTVNNGEFFMIVGPSGAGKTILLEAIAGIRSLCGGKIRIAGRDVTELPPEKERSPLYIRITPFFPICQLSATSNGALNLSTSPTKKGSVNL